MAGAYAQSAHVRTLHVFINGIVQGVGFRPFVYNLATELGVGGYVLNNPQGVLIVAETDPESPARKAGLQPRDRILSVNGKPINAITEEDLPDIRRLLGLLPKYESARIKLLRDAVDVELVLTPREKGDVEGKELDCPRWGFTAKTINQFDNPDLYFYQKEGLFVYGIKYPGNASNAGLRKNDILLKIDGQFVRAMTRQGSGTTQSTEPEGDVLKQGKMRKQGEVLKHQTDTAPVRRQMDAGTRDDLAIDTDGAAINALDAGSDA